MRPRACLCGSSGHQGQEECGWRIDRPVPLCVESEGRILSHIQAVRSPWPSSQRTFIQGQEAGCWKIPRRRVSCRILSQEVIKTWGRGNSLQSVQWLRLHALTVKGSIPGQENKIPYAAGLLGEVGGRGETGGKTWRQWNSLERVCRTGLVPLGASMLDGPWEVDGEQRGRGKGTGGWSTHWSWEDAGSRQPL